MAWATHLLLDKTGRGKIVEHAGNKTLKSGKFWPRSIIRHKILAPFNAAWPHDIEDNWDNRVISLSTITKSLSNAGNRSHDAFLLGRFAIVKSNGVQQIREILSRSVSWQIAFLLQVIYTQYVL